MRAFTQILLLTTAIATTTCAWAARDFTPQAGTWVVSGEVDGKPGRGLAIDVQGNTFFMQVFGYEKDGDATFYTATGQMDGNSVTAPLVRYTGGRSFGSGARDAVEDSSPGQVTVSFRNGLAGTVQFPGEAPVAIARFVVPDMDNRLPGIFEEASPLGPDARIQQRRALRIYALDAQGEPVGEWAAFVKRWWPNAQAWQGSSGLWPPSGDDAIEMQLLNAVDMRVQQTMRCTAQADDMLACTAREELPLADGQKNVFKQLALRRVGADIAGTASTMPTAAGTTAQWRIAGMSANADTRLASSNYSSRHYQFDLVWYGIDPCVTICPPPPTMAMPPNGTWIASDELTGKPGRGISLDVQDNTAIAQVFAYQANGQPSFYMGSTTGGFAQNTINMDLKRYQGGRYFGSKALSASEMENAGGAQFTTDWPNAKGPTVQFPNEDAKPMQRLVVEGSNWQERMLGTWLLTWHSKDAPRFVNLTTIQEDAVISDDGTVQCRPDGASTAYIACEWALADGTVARASPIVAQMLPYASIMNAIRVRDRHGNAVGLGALD